MLWEIFCQRPRTKYGCLSINNKYIGPAWGGMYVVYPPYLLDRFATIMKGYIDRVFSYGFAYRYDNGRQKGLLKGKQAVLINTQG